MAEVKAENILGLRLLNHHLTGDKFSYPVEVVSHLGAVQAQDYASSLLGICYK